MWQYFVYSVNEPNIILTFLDSFLCCLSFCSISNKSISDKGAYALGAALQVNQSLQDLKWVRPFRPTSYFLESVHWCFSDGYVWTPHISTGVGVKDSSMQYSFGYGGWEGPFHSANLSISSHDVSNLNQLNISNLDMNFNSCACKAWLAQTVDTLLTRCCINAAIHSNNYCPAAFFC